MATARRTAAVALSALALSAGLAACGSGSGSDDASTGTTPASSPTVSVPPSTSASAPGSASASPASAGTSTATPATAPLHWTPLTGDPSNTIESNGTWTLTVGQDGDWWSLDQGAKNVGSAAGEQAPKGLKVMDTELDDAWAVVVYGDENGDKQQRAVITSLDSGKVTTLGASSDLPPSSDGSWSLDGSTLWHATDQGKSYCLAATDLASGTSTLSWCAPPRNGFNNVVAAGGQTAMLTFDDKQPSCRTVVTVTGTTITPFPGVEACKGAEGAVLGSGAGAGRVWSVVPNEHRYQQVHVYASTPGGVVDLGAGINSTLTVCGASAYWVRDAAGSTPAAVMRWDGAHATVVYESKGYLGKPLCAGHVLNIAESGDGGDQQLSAPVP